MKSSSFAYERPTDMNQALASKIRWGLSAKFLAGGQSLIPAMNMRFNSSTCLIDLNGIKSMRGIREEGGEIIIGALTRHEEVARSELIKKKIPLLVEASRYLAHIAIRNRGTFGGSVALAHPDAEWPAACLLLNARMRVVSLDGVREVPAADFFQGLYATVLQEDDLLESIAIPVQSLNERSCVIELSRRHGDFATAAVMAKAQGQGSTLNQFAIIFFAVGDQPLCDEELDKSIQQVINHGNLSQIPDIVKTALMKQNIRADLYSNQETKLHLCSILARRAVEKLLKL